MAIREPKRDFVSVDGVRLQTLDWGGNGGDSSWTEGLLASSSRRTVGHRSRASCPRSEEGR